MAGLDMLANNKRARRFAGYTPSGFGEIAGTRFIATAYESPDSIVNIPASFDAIREIEKRNTLIKQRFNVDDPYAVIDVSDIDAKYSNPTTAGRIKSNKEKLERLDQFIQEQRKARPDLWSDIKTKAEIDQPMIGRAREARQIADETLARAESGFAAVGGSLAGGFGGAMTGAINLATLPLGFGASRGVLQTMAMEGVLNAAIEAAQVPMRKEWMDTLGHKYGLKEATADILFAGGGAAALTGVIRGGGRAIRAFNERGSKGMEIMSRMSDDMTVPKEGRDALKYQSRIAHIDEEIPVSGATREDVAVHRANVAETERAIQENRAPVYDEFEGVDYRLDNTRFSQQNVQRIQSRMAGRDGFIVLGKVSKSRAEADKFVRAEAARLGVNRTDFIVENNGDGFSVYRVVPETGLAKADDGKIVEFKDFKAAKDFSDDLNKKNPEAVSKPINFKPEQGKSGQRFFVVSGKGLTEEVYAGIKENPSGFFKDGFSTFSRDKTKSIESDIDDVNIDADLRPIVSEAFPDQRGGFEAMRATVEAAEESAPSFEADFARLLKDNPDMKMDMDGESVSLKEIAARIKEDADVINAMKVCAIG